MTVNSSDNTYLSVIIPAYNAEKWIEKCIQSIFQIDSIQLEIVVINDGSTDNTLKLLQTISDKRLKYYSIENAGVSNARNLGIEKANGKYIWFVDADDFISANALKSVLSRIEDNVDVVMFGYKSQKGNKITENKPCLPEGVYDSSMAKALAKRMLDPFFAKRYPASYIGGKVYQYLIKLDILREKENIRFDKNLPFAEDMCFLATLLNSVEKIKVSDQVCYTYMIYPGTAAHRYREAYWYELCEVLNNVSRMRILSMEEFARLYYRYVKESLLHYAEWSTNYNTIRKYYLEIIDTRKFKKCMDAINYNDWTVLEEIENGLIQKRKIKLLFLIEKMKSVKNRFLEG